MATHSPGETSLAVEAVDRALAPYVGAIEDELRRHRDPGSKIMSMAYDFVEGGGKRLGGHGLSFRRHGDFEIAEVDGGIASP